MSELKNTSTHKVAELQKFNQQHIDDVPVISQIVSPTNDHLSNCLENLWRSCRPGACGGNSWESRAARRRAMLATVEAWCAMESAVNLALYHKLKNKDCGYFLAPIDRKLIDKDIADKLNSSLSFEKRYDYLQESHQCSCTNLKDVKGKVLQFEKLRNTLVYGYAKKKDSLLSILPSPFEVQVSAENSGFSVKREFKIEASEYRNPEGRVDDWLARFKALGLVHDPTELCRHDAGHCMVLVITVLRWLDSHYGISSYATWEAHGERYFFYSRKQSYIQGKGKRIVGFDELWKEFIAKDKKEQSFVTTSKPSEKTPSYRKQMGRRKSLKVR